MESIDTLVVRCWLLLVRLGRLSGRAAADEQGEGVISAAIAVLIMAFLGVIAWLAFKGLLVNTTKSVTTQVNQIGQ